jgi:hypothetical protein
VKAGADGFAGAFATTSLHLDRPASADPGDVPRLVDVFWALMLIWRGPKAPPEDPLLEKGT